MRPPVPEESVTARRRLDRMLEPAYLEGVDARPDDEVRSMKQECDEVETELSYVRRLAQGRMELIRAEQQRRATGGSLEDLVAALPQILAGESRRAAPSRSRLTPMLAPPASIPWVRGRERLVHDDALARLPDLSDEELATELAELAELEREVSGHRRELHAVLDVLERELARR